MYRIVRNDKGWVEKGGNILVVDNDENTTVWVPSNTITVNDKNQPIVRTNVFEEQEARQDINDEEIPTFQFIHESEVVQDNQQESQDDTPEGRKVWSCDHTKALLTTVETRYEDLFHVHKKKTFWNTVANELISQNIEYSATACKKKWANLVRTYKVVKDHKKKTGRGPTRFTFFDQLDALLGDAPTNASPHTIDAALLNNDNNNNVEPSSSETINEEQNEPSVSCTSVSRKRKNPTYEYVKYKQKYYENKEVRAENRRTEQKVYQEQRLRLLQERNAMLREKNEIELRKVEALENFLGSNTD